MHPDLLGNRSLQAALRRNLVSFPAQAPSFGKPPQRELQWRLAVLYFIRGWPTNVLARRYGLTRERCGQIIADWRIRAVRLGYIQEVTPRDVTPGDVTPGDVMPEGDVAAAPPAKLPED